MIPILFNDVLLHNLSKCILKWMLNKWKLTFSFFWFILYSYITFDVLLVIVDIPMAWLSRIILYSKWFRWYKCNNSILSYSHTLAIGWLLLQANFAFLNIIFDIYDENNIEHVFFLKDLPSFRRLLHTSPKNQAHLNPYRTFQSSRQLHLSFIIYAPHWNLLYRCLLR